MNKEAYSRLLLPLLAVILAFNGVDRFALGLVLQDIKTDLSVSDTQLGLLTGVAFAMLYSVMGVPLARWADRGNRVTVISVTTALWSAFVALSGIARTFPQLLLTRVAVGVGEAGCIPPAQSLITDSFSREERPRALARYLLGMSGSVVLGYFLGGWLNEVFGWRKMFMLLGLPGLILAGMAWFFLREPRLQKTFTPASQPSSVSLSDLKTALGTVLRCKTYRHLLLCISVTYFFGAGISLWQPTFFIRSYGLKTGELGSWFALIIGSCGALGIYLGGEWASRRAARDEPRQLAALSGLYASFTVLSVALYLSPSRYLAFVLLGLGALCINVGLGPMYALIQGLVPEQLRAFSVALVYLVANFLGLGLGPLAAGALSDELHPFLGEESLRYSLLALSPGYLWCAWHLRQASRFVSRDLQSVQGTIDVGASIKC